MMQNVGKMVAAVAVCVGVVAGTTSIAAASAVHVGPRQAFVGTVNHRTANAEIKVVCPGPVNTDGHALGGQPLEVELGAVISTEFGYTGTEARAITTDLALNNGLAVRLSRFIYYGVPQPFPTKILIPCSGTGVVSFTPSPTSPSSRPYNVRVTFVNIAT
jgi:hypothetical protein